MELWQTKSLHVTLWNRIYEKQDYIFTKIHQILNHYMYNKIYGII